MNNIFKENDFIKEKKKSLNFSMDAHQNHYFKKMQDMIFQNINELSLDLKIYYKDYDHSILVQGTIKGSLKVISTLSAKIINVKVNLIWDEIYHYKYIDNNYNYINSSDGFDVYEYAIEQIYINLPVNISEKKSLISN